MQLVTVNPVNVAALVNSVAPSTAPGAVGNQNGTASHVGSVTGYRTSRRLGPHRIARSIRDLQR